MQVEGAFTAVSADIQRDGAIWCVFYGIIDILDNPVPENGYSNEAKKSLEEDYQKYQDIVEEYTAKYAMEGF